MIVYDILRSPEAGSRVFLGNLPSLPEASGPLAAAVNLPAPGAQYCPCQRSPAWASMDEMPEMVS
jgi:hypothetical protein